MEFEINELYKYISIFFWCFTRIGAAIIVMPVFGTKMVPSRIKLMLAIVLSVISIPACKIYPSIELLSINSIIIIAQQFIIGMAIGLVLQLVFQIFLLLGEMIAMQSSLSFAVLNDPNTNSSTPVVGEFYVILASYLFLVFDGHLYFCKLLFGSFQLIPIDAKGLAFESYYQVVHMLSWMFANAIKIAMPAITALLMVNIAFGIMTKAAPQLNIFGIGFPITMLVSIGIIWLCLSTIDFHFERLFAYGMDFLSTEILRE
jgi:flagellar biosynthetic protein FliR